MGLPQSRTPARILTLRLEHQQRPAVLDAEAFPGADTPRVTAQGGEHFVGEAQQWQHAKQNHQKARNAASPGSGVCTRRKKGRSLELTNPCRSMGNAIQPAWRLIARATEPACRAPQPETIPGPAAEPAAA